MKGKFFGIIRKIPTLLMRLLKAIGGFFALLGHFFARIGRGIWELLCRNKSFARFAYVTFPVKRDKAIGFIKNNRFSQFIKRNKLKIIIPLAALIVAFGAMLVSTVKNSENSDYFPEYVPLGQYGMRVFTYQTFDHSDIKRGSIFLGWTDGVLNLAEGETTARIKATVYPINMDDTQIEWSVSDEEYATIDQNGVIEAKAPGRVRIYARLVNYGAVAEAKLLIRQPVTGVILPTSTLTLYKGGSARYLDARIFPANATNKNVSWSSKNPRIATVDQNGTVKPVSAGMTEITATTEEGGFEAKCFVTVVNPSVDVESLTLQNGRDMTMTEGDSVNAVVTVTPINARNKTLKWSSSNTSVASVSQTGRIRAVGEGTANITAESVNGIRITFEVAVNAAEKEPEETESEYPADGSVVYTSYNVTFPEAVATQMAQNPPPKKWTAGGGVYATEAETAEYMNPNNYFEDVYKYQFLDLSMPNGVSEDALNAYLADKGVLRGQAAAFIRAANEYGLSEIYLVAHACLETGNGTSQLSRGREVNGTTVYNMFGIGAYDDSALSSGALRAYQQGWTSVEASIMGGAQWISEHYINSGITRQNTLYKMLWNPERPGYHQYATDIGWAVKQAVSISKMFASLGGAAAAYEVPVYNGMIPPVINTN